MNWKVRIKNKWFWITLIPAVLLLVQQVLAIFGVTIDLHDVEAQVLAVVETVFLILGILGITVDMTTDGIGDSERAMGYEKPWKEESNELQ